MINKSHIILLVSLSLMFIVILLFHSSAYPNEQIFDDEQCDAILQTAYASGMAVFTSCVSKIESVENNTATIKVIIHLQGGILGTPYLLKGRVIIDQNRGYLKTRWVYWNSPLTPIERTEKIDIGKTKWDF